MQNNNSIPTITVSGSIPGKCTECGHRFVPGDEVLITSAICKVVDGKLVINDIAPEVICFPSDSDGHYDEKQ
jgi:hypothetical protein